MTTIDHHATSEPAAPAQLQLPASSEAPATTSVPAVTIAILMVMGLVFAAELLIGVEPWKGALRPGVTTLLAFGGLQHLLVVDQGQWFRLFSAPLLHLDATHVVINGLVLWYGGRALEAMIGRLWFATIFILGGLAGAAASLGGNPHNVVSVGASGAIMAVLAATYVLALHYGPGPRRSATQSHALRLLIPSLIPLGVSFSTSAVDYHAHFGGTVAGALIAALLLAIWSSRDATPGMSFVAAAILAIGLSATVYSAAANAGTYRIYNMTHLLIPSADIPKGTPAVVAKAPDLLKQYPADPRAHLYQAIALAQAKDLAGAEQQVRIALADKDKLRLLFTPWLKTHLESYLALILTDEQRKDEATKFAKAGCLDTSAPLHAALVKAGLCEVAKS
jgi:rhomboid protease GluP